MRRALLLLLVPIFPVTACRDSEISQTSAIELSVASEDLQLGSLDGNHPAGFGRISGILGDSSGRIFVADQQAADVRVFDSAGVYLFSFGRKGEGPGEFGRPCCMAWGPNGLLWIRDGGNHRYAAFEIASTGAVYHSSVEMAHSDITFQAPLTFSSAGHLVDVGHRTAPDGTRQLVRFELSVEGRVLSTTVVPQREAAEIGQFAVTRETVSGLTTQYFYQPFAPDNVVAHGPLGSWAHGLSSEYTLRLAVDNDSVVVARGMVGPALSDAERRLGTDQMTEDAEAAGIPFGQLPYGVPNAKPPVADIFFDTSGRLWVELSGSDGAPRVADVWDQNGSLVRKVEWPRSISLSPPGWVDTNRALGRRSDALGVEYVVQLRF